MKVRLALAVMDGFPGNRIASDAFLKQESAMRPRENRDTKSAMTDTAAVQRYSRLIEIIVAALAIALAAGLLAYARIGA